MASNENSLLDGNENAPDWIEIYNSTNEPISLHNWQLSDDAAEVNKWLFPEISIPAKGFLIILASSENRFDGLFWHSNFKLAKSGEELLLSNAEGQLIDYVEFTEQETDQSFGRMTDGSEDFTFFIESTPARSNNQATPSTTFEVALSFSQPSGFYAEEISLQVFSDVENVTLKYTLDGSIPDENSPVLEGVIELKADNVIPTDFSEIKTAKDWEKPSGKTEKYHNIRVRAFKNGQVGRQILTGNFIIGEEAEFPYTLPVVAITTAGENLFSEDKGIYVKGKHDNFRQSGRDWERPAHFSYFSKEGKLQTQQNIGIRIGGATSREEPQKTLKLYARSEYGQSHFEYPFFGGNYDTKFKRLAIRTMMGDKTNRSFTDDFCQQLIQEEVECDYVRRQFVIVLVNGEYWGIHSLRELVNEHFMAQKAEVEKEEIDYLFNEGGVKNGSNADYLALIDFVKTNSLAETANYNFVAHQIDIERFIDYNAVQFALANDDWPNNNVKFWKAKNGQWRWVINDLDDTMKEINQARWRLFFEEHRNHHTKWEELEWAFALFGELLKNKDFRMQFVERFNKLMNTTFSPNNTLPLLEKMTEELRPEMQRHIDRWHFPKNKNKWEKGIEQAENFLLRRSSFVLKEIYEWFGSNYEWFPNPAHDFVYLNVPENRGQEAYLTVINTMGQTVFQRKMSLSGAAEQLTIELPFARATGLYFFQLDIGWQVLTEAMYLEGF